ncbi:hypothetical protein V6N11_026116 [Hibiscus sabdariffa]|uniref:RNase H type-1 domain-containing protein n=1 Tax=Hibiscus sabdariffa TaxID=183260 RepID=A0ABR2SVE2_9ROSI
MYVDCLDATRFINSSSDALAGSALVTSIKGLMGCEWRVVVHHVSRRANRVAGMLAVRGRDLGMYQSVFRSLPDEITPVLEEKLMVPNSTVSKTVGIG